MGLVKLMKDNDETIGALLNSAKPYEGEVGNLYTFTLAGSADAVTPALIKGDLDMATWPPCCTARPTARWRCWR